MTYHRETPEQLAEQIWYWIPSEIINLHELDVELEVFKEDMAARIRASVAFEQADETNLTKAAPLLFAALREAVNPFINPNPGVEWLKRANEALMLAEWGEGPSCSKHQDPPNRICVTCWEDARP